MAAELILIGSGGHCRSCIEVIETTPFRIAGVLDKNGQTAGILGYSILGSDEMLPELVTQSYQFLITVGQVRAVSIRKNLYELLKKHRGQLATVVAHSAQVSKRSEIGEGSIIMHQALVNSGASIGVNCIINTKSLIEHDCIVGNHTHISTGAVVNGGCKIGDDVFIGSNTVIIQGITITEGVTIGAGTVIARDILDPGTYVGNPARKI